MAGDYSRLNYDPKKRHAELLMQQGRVQLDSDWNAMMDMVARRFQVQATDTFGHCAVPRLTTPNAFLVTPVGPPVDLQLGAGRLYADGLIAEIFPDESVTYLQQPFWPTPTLLSQIGSDSALIIIDVWNREVTYIEDNDLLEQALGGPDTSTRLQTVWQVKLVASGALPGPLSCDVDLGALFPPSAGRVSTRAVQIPLGTDPCVLPQMSGYRGIENRLYRVEIHTAGDATTARFKWSRDNASIVSRVEKIATAGVSTLTVSRIGRDPILRFQVNDWVEVLDDALELSGQAGSMAQVLKVDEATRTLELDRALPASFNAADPKRHTRVRRWDQQAGVDADGLLPIPSGWFAIEDGVEVMLALDPTLPSGKFHVADQWVFAARSADASVEILNAAPPRAIIHHYCVLGTVTGLSGTGLPTIHDCRNLWPPVDETPSCDCTVCVSAEAHNNGTLQIQAAIDNVERAGGGKVCLEPGVFVIQSPLLISGAQSLQLVGHGDATVLLYVGPRPGTVIRVTDASMQVTIEKLSIPLLGTNFSPDLGAEVGIAVSLAAEVTIENCTISTLAPSDPAAPPAPRNPTTAIALDGVLVGTKIRNNTLVTDFGIRNSNAGPTDLWLSFDLLICDNWIGCGSAGIALNAGARGRNTTMVHMNTVVRQNLFLCDRAAVLIGGITILASSVVVEDNELQMGAAGIGLEIDRAIVRDNRIRGRGARVDPTARTPGVGIVSTLIAGRCEVSGNSLSAISGNGIQIEGLLTTVDVDNNQLEAIAGAGVFVRARGHASVSGNHISNVGTGAATGVFPNGIMMTGLNEGTVDDNVVVGVGRNAASTLERAGIGMISVNSLVVSGNEIADVGPVQNFATPCYGIYLSGFNDGTVSANSVRRARVTNPTPGPAHWNAIAIGVIDTVVNPPPATDVSTAPSTGPSTGPSIAPVSSAFARLTDSGVVHTATASLVVSPYGIFALDREREGSVGVEGNYLDGVNSISSLVRIAAEGAVDFSSNRCRVLNTSADPVPGGPGPAVGVVLRAPRIIVGNNQVAAGHGLQAIALTIDRPHYTVLGNVVTGEITVDSGAGPTLLAAPWAPLNVMGV